MTAPSAGAGPARAARPVLVTRPAERAERLIGLLEQEGLTVEHSPFVRLRLEHDADLREEVAALAAGAYTHLVITSRTAVEALAAFRGEGPDPVLTVPAATRVVAVGEGTARALTDAGIEVALVAGGSGADLVAQMPPASPGDRVLFPASAAAAPTVPQGLAAAGYAVSPVIAYRPRAVPQPAAVVRGLALGSYAALVLTSPMIARLAASLRVHLSIPVVAIGRPTQEAAREAGLTVHARAREATDEALALAVSAAIAEHPRS